MALPVAHVSLVFGLVRPASLWRGAVLGILSVLPDADFILVWWAGFPVGLVHRTWSHSLLFALLAALLWRHLRPRIRLPLASWEVFVALASHGVLDLLCTADAADHGVVLFWPLGLRLGWAVLVPLYALFGDSPFSWGGALAFTLLEVGLAPVLWGTGRWLRGAVQMIRRTPPNSASP